MVVCDQLNNSCLVLLFLACFLVLFYFIYFLVLFAVVSPTTYPQFAGSFATTFTTAVEHVYELLICIVDKQNEYALKHLVIRVLGLYMY